MNIGIYNPRVGFSQSGGTETFLREIMKRLGDDHEVTLYCGEGELLNEVRTLDVNIEQIPLTKKESQLNTTLTNKIPILPAEVESITMYRNARHRGIFKKMADEVDVVSTHYYLDNLLVSRATQIPTIFRFPGIKKPSIRWKMMTRFARPECYLANSEATAGRLQRWLNLDVDGTVYAGVDLEQFSPDTDPAFDCEETAVLFVGRLDEGKGLYDLLEAQKQLKGTKLYIVGGGTLEIELHEYARDLNITSDVEFVGSVPHDEVHHYYRAADIFCLPSYHEGFPVVNMEAMASGCPVVSTHIDSVQEQVVDGESALLVDPGDVRALTDTLNRLVNDKDLRDRLAKRGLARASNFSWEKQAVLMEEYYEKAR